MFFFLFFSMHIFTRIAYHCKWTNDCDANSCNQNVSSTISIYLLLAIRWFLLLTLELFSYSSFVCCWVLFFFSVMLRVKVKGNKNEYSFTCIRPHSTIWFVTFLYCFCSFLFRLLFVIHMLMRYVGFLSF